MNLCIEDLPFIQNSFTIDPSVPLENHYASMAQHLAHEYFHHYQGAHALDRGLDHQADRENPETTVQAPRWWIEGAAVTFQNAWFQSNWESLSFLTEPSGVSIAGVSDTRTYKRVRRSIHDTLPDGERRDRDCAPDWYMTSADNLTITCDGAMLANAFIAYRTSYKTPWIDIPQDYYDLEFGGAIEKHLDLTEQGFYDAFNAFIRSGDPGDEPPPGWAPPKGPVAAYADFLQIIPEDD
jgi:hypothetical protein